VDAQFWALVCEDEEWLQAEFDAIISAPAGSAGVPFLDQGSRPRITPVGIGPAR